MDQYGDRAVRVGLGTDKHERAGLGTDNERAGLGTDKGWWVGASLVGVPLWIRLGRGWDRR